MEISGHKNVKYKERDLLRKEKIYKKNNNWKNFEVDGLKTKQRKKKKMIKQASFSCKLN